MTDAPVIQTAQVLSERYGPAYRWLSLPEILGVESLCEIAKGSIKISSR